MQSTIRFSGIFTAPEIPVHILGCGAIGSMAALAIAKSGFKTIHVYDFDKVAIENVGTQIYGHGHIGEDKASALSKIVASLSEVTPITHIGYAQDFVGFGGILVVAFDSMAARRSMWDYVKRHQVKYDLYIDARMGAEHLLLFGFPRQRRHEAAYEATLLDDAATHDVPCTAKGTAYTSLFAGAHIMATIKKHFTADNADFMTVMHNISGGTLLQ